MVFKFRGEVGFLGIVGLLALGGCGTLSSITGGSSEAAPPSASRSSVTGSSWRDAFIFGASTPPPIVKPDENNRVITCPAVAVIDGTSAYRVARTEQGSEGVNYQASVAQFARECRLVGNTLEMRVGVDGRMLLGPQGKPGTYSVPVRVAVKRGDAVVYSKLTRESVTVPSDETGASFTHIEEGISLPVGAQDPGGEYDVLVGFDPDGGEKAARPKAKRRR